jgi:hypothetical protein
MGRLRRSDISRWRAFLAAGMPTGRLQAGHVRPLRRELASASASPSAIPHHPGRLSALETFAHRAARDPDRVRDLPLAELALVLQPQNFSDLSRPGGASRGLVSSRPSARPCSDKRATGPARDAPTRGASLFDSSSAAEVKLDPAPAAGGWPGQRNRWPGCRNRWPGCRNRWPGAVGPTGRVTSERVAGSRRNTQTLCAAIAFTLEAGSVTRARNRVR